VEVPSLQTLEKLLASSEPGSGGSGGSSGGSSSGTSAGTHAAAPGSGFVLSASAASAGAFRVLSVSVTKTGRILETVALPAAGVLVVKASEKRRAGASRRSSRGGRGASARVVPVAKFSAHVSRGVAVIALNPKLSQPKSRLVVATSYTPSGAVATTITRSVVVRRATSSRRKRH
jgi:hypothetical protein